jgi:hypothetical protein
VKSAGVRSYDSARGKLSANNTPTRAKPPPPPPPRRASSNIAFGDTSRGTACVEEIDWANLSDEDKQAFFSWLDEFFARYLALSPPAMTAPAASISAETSSNAPAPSPRSSPSLPPRRISSRASQNTGLDPPDILLAAPVGTPPAPPHRNLPPTLTQRGPVGTPLKSVIHPNHSDVAAKDQPFHKANCTHRRATATITRPIHQVLISFRSQFASQFMSRSLISC